MQQSAPAKEDDAALYRRYRAGDGGAFELLYARYRQPLYLFLLRSGLPAGTAEDLYQELWLRVIHGRDSFDGGNLRAWLFRIARNLRIDHLRRTGLRAADTLEDEPAAAHPPPDRELDALDCVERMKHGVAALPPPQRDAFLLKEEAGLSLEEIAQLMAVGRENIKSRLRYAMQKLRKLLEDCL